MAPPLVLASGSPVRSQMLSAAGVVHRIDPARVDEEALKAALAAEQAPPRDVADVLAEMKARKVSDRSPGALVLGCDQVLSFEGRIYGKPASREEAREMLETLRGATHSQISAAVICEDGTPTWRHVAVARLTMRDVSDAYLDAYLDRNWPDIGATAGGYMVEAEGLRLFAAISGEYHTVLGLPLLPLLNHLTLRGVIDG